MNDTENLKDLDREQLDNRAVEVGISDPKLYGKKGDLLVAVEAALAGDPIPEPEVEGKTVTFTGCTTDETVKSVLVGDTRFRLDVPTRGVDAATVKLLADVEDHEFEIE